MSRVKILMPDHYLFSTRHRVGISDLNYARHLNSVAMVHILHEARLQFLAHLGFTEANIFGLGMVVTDLGVDYRSESFANDWLTIDVGVGLSTATAATSVSASPTPRWRRSSAMPRSAWCSSISTSTRLP